MNVEVVECGTFSPSVLLGDQLHWNDLESWTLGVCSAPSPLPRPLLPILNPSLSTSGTAAHQPCRYHQHGRNGAGRYVCSPGCESFGPAPCPALGCWHAARLNTRPAPPHPTPLPPCLLPPPPPPPLLLPLLMHMGIFRRPSWHHGASPVGHLPENLEALPYNSPLVFVRVCVLTL